MFVSGKMGGRHDLPAESARTDDKAERSERDVSERSEQADDGRDAGPADGLDLDFLGSSLLSSLSPVTSD